MSLEAAVRSVGLDLALRQADSVYQLSRQSSTHPDAIKVAKMRLSFSQHLMWIKTSNAKVTECTENGSTVYRTCLRFQVRPGQKAVTKRGKRLNNRAKAEEAMFDERCRFEGKATKQTTMQVIEGGAELETMPKKVSLVDSEGGKKAKATMRHDHAARSSNRPNRNPNGPGDISAVALADRYGGSNNWSVLIQRTRARSFLTKASRNADVKVLSEAFGSKKWWMLMPYGEDEEVRIDATDTDKSKLMTQAKCVLTALETYGKHHDNADGDGANENSYTWRQACKDAVVMLKEEYIGQTVERWYMLFRYNTEQVRRFPLSMKGKQSNGTLCPFSLPDESNEQDNLVGHEHRQEILDFRLWFDENQKTMSCAKARMWFEGKVKELAVADPYFLERYKIRCLDPLSPYVAKCWMREMGVEHCRTVKNYYVIRHESEKAKKQRGVYIPWSFKNELCELCWVQLNNQELIGLASKMKMSEGNDATASAASAKEQSNT